MFRIPCGRLLHDKVHDFLLQQSERGKFPIRRVTNGLGFYWRGYYDKLLFDPTNRFLLANRSDFENRTPQADDKITVGMIDLEDGDRWIDLGESSAWNWQQGCMLQWVPGSKSTVVWNDRQGDRFVSHFLDVRSRENNTLPYPIYCLSQDGRWALSLDFRRLHDVRPGYGYAGISDPNKNVLAPEDSGIWKIDLASGKSELILSVAQVAAFPHAEPCGPGSKHRIEHLLFNPDGDRFIFLHRWEAPGQAPQFSTRMFTASADGTDLHVIDPHGQTSHFDWRDNKNILAWAWHPIHGERFLLFRDRSNEVSVVGEGVMMCNGHPTYFSAPHRDWIVNDTYPDKYRHQRLYLFQESTQKRMPIGLFRAPADYTGEWRCDFHPAISRDCSKISFDSAHGRSGRQVYLAELPSDLLNNNH
jgi:hypothetical protein